MLIYLIIFTLGLIFGSFANVWIYRLPLDQSIVRPRSFCPSCQKSILWYDNIPVLSYILLKGRCRFCAQRISLQYPLIEFLTAVLFLLGWFRFQGIAVPLFLTAGFYALVITGIDLEHQIIPDSLSLSLLLVGLFLSPFNPFLCPNTAVSRVINSFLGLFSGGLFFYLIAVLGKKILKQDALGGGDIKLIAAWGAWIGWPNVLLCILLASFLGTMVGLPLRVLGRLRKLQPIPFGPFLCLAAVLILIFHRWFREHPWFLF